MTPQEIITNKIIKKLEAGIIPWRKPWHSVAGQPQNLMTGKPYRGINRLILGASDYASPYWLTFLQCKKMGGSVNAGAQAEQVVFWKIDQQQKPLPGSDPKDPNTEEEERPTETSYYRRPLLRYYNVFNLQQISGITAPEQPETKTLTESEKIDAAEAVIEGYLDKPPISYGGDKACYSPIIDSVKMPAKTSFDSLPEFYCTLFHELSHSTGHKTRLDRLTDESFFGNESCSKEELIAEISQCFIMNELNLLPETFENSVAYLQNWIKQLRNDSKLIIQASGAAEKSANWIKGIMPESKK